MDGTKSNAGGFEYKLKEVNIAQNWNPKANNPSLMGGFNFSTDTKILRWLHRGNTLYDVKIPKDAEMIDCQSANCPHGVFRTNKIIVSNPRAITENMVIDLYKISELPEKTYYQCLVTLLYKNHIKTVKYIIKDRINKDNVDECLQEFERMVIDKHDGKIYKFSYNKLGNPLKEIYDILRQIKEQSN